MAIITTGTAALADTFKTMYSRDLLMEAEPNLLHANFGSQGRIVGGKTIEIRKMAALPTKTGTLTEGVTPAPDSLAITKITATAEQVGAWVQYTDLVDLTAYDNIAAETARLQGDQAGRTYDYRIREQLNQGTNVTYVGQTARGDITNSNVVTGTVVKKVVRKLRNNNAKGFASLGGAYAGLCDPDVEFDLLADTEFQNVVQYNSAFADRFEGRYLGRAWGVEWFRSTHTKQFEGEGNSNIDVHSTLILGEGAYGVFTLQDLEFIIKPIGSAGADDPLNQRGSMGWKGSFIAKILFDAYMERIESGATQ